MEWTQHEVVRHVLFASSQNRGVLMLHFHCQACGDTTEIRCGGFVGMPRYRLNEYANQHSHGYCPPIHNPHPR